MHAASMREQGRHRKEESGLFQQDDGVYVQSTIFIVQRKTEREKLPCLWIYN
jgi:hypothetical protein